MGFIKEFKDFAMKGNVVDLAVAVIIGTAFGKIITSFIDDIITPLLLKPALQAAHLTNIQELTIFNTVKYGNFLSSLISFVIIALVLFVVIKGLNATKRKEVKAPLTPPIPSKEELLLTEIRDILKSK
jgi:large conductance mechanosensitive channel